MFQGGWRELTVDGTTNTAAADTRVVASAPPSTDESNGLLWFRPGESDNTMAELMFTSDDVENNTFGVNIYGWNRVSQNAGASCTNLWIPTLLVSGTATIGAKTGVSGLKLPDTQLFVDTFTISADHTRDDSAQMNGPTDGIGGLSFDMMDNEIIQIEVFSQTATKVVRVFQRYVITP